MKKINFSSLIIFFTIIFLNNCSSYEKEIAFVDDPYEKTNRKIFKFNQSLDKYILRPTSELYTRTLNKKVRKGISNHLDWISTPKTILNSGLQLKGENFMLSSIDFLMNSLTLGFYDLNESENNFYKLDFGSTLANYKISRGPYLIVPVLGPRTLRHFSGDVINFSVNNSYLFDEFNNIKKYQTPINLIDKRSNLSNIVDDINSSSDPYIKMRSIYLQNRQKSLFFDKEYEEQLYKKEEEEFEKLLE